MKRLVGSVAGIAFICLLTGCVPSPGPLLEGYPEGSSCTGSDRRPSYQAAQYIENTTDSRVVLTAVEPASYVNTRARATLVGAEVPTLIVGGYPGGRNLDTLHTFSKTGLNPGETAVVVFVGDVRNADEDAKVDGVHVRYSTAGQQFEGTIPWTYTFAAGKCPS